MTLHQNFLDFYIVPKHCIPEFEFSFTQSTPSSPIVATIPPLSSTSNQIGRNFGSFGQLGLRIGDLD